MIRFVNGLLGAAAAILFAIHSISMGMVLAGYIQYSYSLKYWAYALLVCLILHAVISIALVVFETGKNRIDRYAKVNAGIHLQRISGIILIVLVYFHMNAYGYLSDDGVYILKEPTMTGFLSQVALALIAGFHMVTGLPKSMISLGCIRDAKEMKAQKNFVYMVFFIVEAVAIYGACIYFGVI